MREQDNIRFAGCWAHVRRKFAESLKALNNKAQLRKIMDRKKELLTYLSGTLGQISIISIVVFLLRSIGMKIDYTTALGMLAIGIGGISSALWGVIVTIRYKKATLKEILIDFINVCQPFSSYILVFVFLLLD